MLTYVKKAEPHCSGFTIQQYAVQMEPESINASPLLFKIIFFY